jgi:hypothetical protein
VVHTLMVNNALVRKEASSREVHDADLYG